MTNPGSGWYPDPTGRHQTRWWDGVEWRGWVDGSADDEVDPPVRLSQPAPAPPTPSAAPPRSGLVIGCLAVAALGLVTIATLLLAGAHSLDAEWDCAMAGTSCGDRGGIVVLTIGLGFVGAGAAFLILWLVRGPDRAGRGFRARGP